MNYLLLGIGMFSCVASLYAIALCRSSAMADRQSDKFIQQSKGRDIGLWKITWSNNKGEVLARHNGQYINDMLSIVKEVTTSEGYLPEEHYLTVEFD